MSQTQSIPANELVPVSSLKPEAFYQERDTQGRFLKGAASWNKGRGMSPEERDEARRQSLKRYNNSPARKAKMRAYGEAYRLSGKKSEVGRRYHATEKGILTGRQSAQNRLARKKGLLKRFNPEYWKWVCWYMDYRCQLCRDVFPFSKLTVDHQIPISRGGDNDEWNIQPMCKACKSRKRDRLMGLENIELDIAYGDYMLWKMNESLEGKKSLSDFLAIGTRTQELSGPRILSA